MQPHLRNKSIMERMKNAASVLDLVQKALTCVAFVVGGLWAYFQFHIGGDDNWMNNLSLQTEVLPYKGDLRLLVVHIKSKNPRPVKFELNKPNDSFTLTVRELPFDLKSGNAISGDAGKIIGKPIDLLAVTGEDLMPNAEFDDMTGIILPACALVSLTADMEIGNGTKDKTGKPDRDTVSAATIVRVTVPSVDGDCLKR